MDTIEAIRFRRSIRRYKTDPIPEEHLEIILGAGRAAPSARNRQPWHFVVVTDGGTRAKLAGACMGQLWLARAPVMIVAVGLPEVSRAWYPVDVSIALQNMVLAATSLGYGTCWVGAFHEGAVKAILGIPREAKVIAVCPLGVPAERPRPRKRNAPEQVFSLDRYGQSYPFHRSGEVSGE